MGMNRFLFPSFDHFSSYCTLLLLQLILIPLSLTTGLISIRLYNVAGLDPSEETLGSLRKFAAGPIPSFSALRYIISSPRYYYDLTNYDLRRKDNNEPNDQLLDDKRRNLTTIKNN
jgi:hypothetical protein